LYDRKLIHIFSILQTKNKKVVDSILKIIVWKKLKKLLKIINNDTCISLIAGLFVLKDG
jgi:hypothetical protein